MLLAIDVGNTNTVLGLYRLANGRDAGEAGRKLAHHDACQSRQLMSLACLLRNLFGLKGIEIGVVTGIAISSVVPPLDSMLRQVCELYFKVKPLFIEPGVKTGMPVLTDNPSEVGADRIVNCVAAFERFGGPMHRRGYGNGNDV